MSAIELIHNLSEPELAEVARIILNWGTVDYLVGQSLTFGYGLVDNKGARADLIEPLDLRKKVNLLKNKLKAEKASEEVMQLVKLIAKACEDWSTDRNHLAHGVSMVFSDGSEGIFSPRREPMVTKADLPRLRARSDYVADLAIRLQLTNLPHPEFEQGPLPDKPE